MPPFTIDPSLFCKEAIAPETQAVNDRIEAFLKELPSVVEVGAEAVRARRKRGEGLLADEPPHPAARWETATALGQSVPVRIISPLEDIRGVYIHIHGGGHTLGSAGAQDQTLVHMATALQMTVVSIEYRLAPEHPWPAPADDCEVACLWVVDQLGHMFDTQNLFIGGESAGGHLSAVSLLRLKNRHHLTPFRAANFVYGAFDMNGLPSLHRWGPRNLIINTPIVKWFSDNLLPPSQFSVEDRRDPDISPLYADLSALCPALFTIGTLDPLLDDSLLMATKWALGGNRSELAVYPGGIHAFNSIPDLAIGKAANGRMVNFIGGCLD